jgi:hypothetical protein
MKAHLALEKISSKLLRPWIGNFISKKRISQNFFAKLVSELESIIEGQKIQYVPSDELSGYLSRTPTRNLPKVLVAGGSDYDLKLSDYETIINLKGTSLYIQNLDFPETEIVKSLPIGVEDYRWARNAMPWNFGKRMVNREKVPKVLVGPFGPTHPERERCLKEVSGLKLVQVCQERIPNWTYSKLSSKYLYVACPRGNGLDTHRFWETLYRGSIPVVIESNWSRNMQSYGIPIVSLSNWWEIDEVLGDFQQRNDAVNLEYLDPSWWRTRLIEDVFRLSPSVQG